MSVFDAYASRQAIDTSSPLGFVWHYISGGRKLFFTMFTLVFLAACCAVGVQYGMKVLVDSMSLPSRSIQSVAWPFGIFVVLVGVESVLWRTAGWMGAHAIVEAGVKIRLDLFDRLAGRPLAFFSASFSGALGGRITAVSGAFGALANTFIWNILPPCTDFAGALVLFSMLDLGMSASVLLLVVTMGAGLFLFGLRGRGHHQLYAERAGWASGELVDTIANIRLVKMFGTSRSEHQRLNCIFNEEASAQRRSWTYLEKSRILHDLVLWIAAACVLGWAILRWAKGQFTPGDVVLVSALTFRILHGSRDLALALIGASNQLAVIRETLQLLHCSQSKLGREPRPLSAQPPLIEIRDLWFSYDGGHPVLKGLTVEIPPGQKIGIIGRSGAGKSTLLSLIQALHEPRHGEIRLDGASMRDFPDETIRDTIAFVPQDVSLFHRTIMQNLRYGCPSASEAEVAAAVDAAQCHFIDDLPDGYNTVVGERGAILSGGQRQRLAIARALLKGSPVLLLDEATSALDGETERRLRVALLQACGHRTVISATHHLATLQLFDRVIVLKHGVVVEDGPPALVLSSQAATTTLRSVERAAIGARAAR
jgi:ATP-binding cassette subfamily B protein